MDNGKIHSFSPRSSDCGVAYWLEAWARLRLHYITEYRKEWSLDGSKRDLRRMALHYGRLVRKLGVRA